MTSLSKSNKSKSPLPTVDIIIRYREGVVLIKRKNEPHGWAIPGGFVDYGESLETAACREAKEETGLDVKLLRQFHTYSDPERDKRMHTITTVYVAEAHGEAQAGDDAAEYGVFMPSNLPNPIVFDHKRILADYFNQVY
ncbi:MAG: NUDIX hydrolase [Nitrospirae bacterium]|nr:NUDIX hydrolase [Nitrospirota bacterium]